MKHMWPGDVEIVLDDLTNDLSTTWFDPGTRPFFFNEVIDLGGESITAEDYIHLGRVTEFKYSSNIGKGFRNHFPLKDLLTIGPSWGMLADEYSLVFIDNHDNQRGHGAGGPEVLTFWEPRLYKMATAFTLANDYAFTRIMSSYYWDGGRWNGDWIGPPANADWSVKDVPILADGTCGDGWICEHRWRQIKNMVKFRNVVHGEVSTNKWDNGNNQISFSRGTKGFIAINTEFDLALDELLPTGLSAGVYCDVISGDLDNGVCTGKEVLVDAGGYSQLYIDVTEEDPMIAIHQDSKRIDSTVTPTTQPPTTVGTTAEPPVGYTRTVVLMYLETQVGQDLFLRGGINHDHRPGCTEDASTSACAVPILHDYLGSGTHYEKYNKWKTDNTRLNWYGPQTDQGIYYGQPAQGSPLVWTTDDPTDAGYQPVNRWGPHYWLLDVAMDCSTTEGGWFEVKGFLTSDNVGDGWEVDIDQVTSCTGTGGGSKPYSSNNHFARCGYINVIGYNMVSCHIDEF